MLKRREWLFGFGALSACAALKPKTATAHQGHDHQNPHAELAKEAQACVAAGEACLDHCIQLLSKGDRSMADCAARVREMLAVCEATAKLASSGSALLPKMAALCADACRACQAACAPHAKHHATCKACHDACARTHALASKV